MGSWTDVKVGRRNEKIFFNEAIFIRSRPIVRIATNLTKKKKKKKKNQRDD
jgi:hypothetical protein